VPDRGGEEQGVQRQAVESFPGVAAGGDEQQRPAAWPGLEALEYRGAGPGTHATAQHDRVVAYRAQGSASSPRWATHWVSFRLPSTAVATSRRPGGRSPRR
jgi:hypothetical protein